MRMHRLVARRARGFGAADTTGGGGGGGDWNAGATNGAAHNDWEVAIPSEPVTVGGGGGGW